MSKYRGNLISAADKILGDFRKGFLGGGSLEAPPTITRSKNIPKEKGWDVKDDFDDSSSINKIEDTANSNNTDGLDIGKGNYDGW
jgi:hypothetical protein